MLRGTPKTAKRPANSARPRAFADRDRNGHEAETLPKARLTLGY